MKIVYEQLKLAERERSFLFQKIITNRFDHPWHFHPELELTWIKQGSGIRYVGDHIEHFASDDLIFAGSGLPHQWNSYRSENISEAFVLQFSYEDLLGIKEIKQLLPLFDRSRLGLAFEATNQIKRLFEAMENENRLERLSSLFRILSILNGSTYRTLSSRSYSWSADTSRKTEHIITYIQEHLREQLTIPEMAERAHMTVPSFCRWFKRITGKTFIDFVNSSRIELAASLLSQEITPITEVAYKSGFNSISQFNRTFRKYKAKTPKEWRNERLNARE